MRHLTILAGTLLLLRFLSYGLDPPVKLWEKQYSFPGHSGCYFRDIEITPDGNLFIAGYSTNFSNPDSLGYCAFLLDQEGNLIWAVDYTTFSMFTQDGVVLPDSSMAITGYGQPQYGGSRELFIMKIDSNGDTEWTKYYDYPNTKEEGYGITCLPDGGFAVCGRVHGTGTINAGQMWLLRTDANGDTLWTREWGSTVANSPDWGKSVLFSNDEICVLAHGLTDSLPTYGPHLLFYDLDGNYLRGTDYPTLYYRKPASFCIASDGGYTLTTELWPPVWHTDQYGETLWWKSIYVTPNDWHKGYCIRQTMDSGYIFSGWDGYFEYEPGGNLTDYEEGWLARFDSDGNELWNINNTISVNHAFYSCLQLPQGGYMACGGYGVFEYPSNGESRGSTGFLVRYAPETGISSPDPVSSLSLEVSPNPFSSVLSASFDLPEENQITLTVYDLYGRTVGETTSGSYPGGTSDIEWTPPPELGSGCYFVMLNTSEESVTKSCVFIR